MPTSTLSSHSGSFQLARRSGGRSRRGCPHVTHLTDGAPSLPSREPLQGRPLLQRQHGTRVGAVRANRSRRQPERPPSLARPGGGCVLSENDSASATRAQQSHRRREPERPPRAARLRPGPSLGLEDEGVHVPASPRPGSRRVSTAPWHLHPQAAPSACFWLPGGALGRLPCTRPPLSVSVTASLSPSPMGVAQTRVSPQHHPRSPCGSPPTAPPDASHISQTQIKPPALNIFQSLSSPLKIQTFKKHHLFFSFRMKVLYI